MWGQKRLMRAIHSVSLALLLVTACWSPVLALDCSEATDKMFALDREEGFLMCEADAYAGHTDFCIPYQEKRLAAMRVLVQMKCTRPGAKFTWQEMADTLEAFIVQMRQFPGGPQDILDQMERAREEEAERLSPSRQRRP